MKIRLITDSTCDLTPEFLKERGIYFESLKVLFSDAEYTDKIDLSTSDFYEKMSHATVLPTTSQVNPSAFETRFLEVLNNDEQVLALLISSELSGTFSAASIAKASIEELHPQFAGRITLIDSKTTSFGLGLLVIQAQDYIDQNTTMENLVNVLTANANRQQLYGLLSTLDNLVKGGRLSAGSAFIGNLLNVKPIIEVKDGKVAVANKVRGKKKGIQWMIEQVESHYPSKHIPIIGVAHANNLDNAAELEAALREHFTIDQIYIIEIGPVVGTHVGPNAMGITFFKNL